MRKLKLDELGRLSEAEFQQAKKLPVTVVLDNIRSALNVGSIFRSCDGFAIEEIILTGITAQPPHREITKTAIGATRTISWKYEQSVVFAIEKLKKKDYHIIGIEQTSESESLNSWSLPEQKLAVIFGNEVDGLSSGVIPLLDGAIEIDQYGTKHSLNVAVCAGIVLWRISSLIRHQS